MEIRFFKEFIALAEAKNYLVASDNLFISQSSLSKHIKNMEEEMGVSLFDRTTRNVKLTEEGESFLVYAKKIVEEYEKGLLAVDQTLKNKGLSLTIGVPPSLAEYNITNIIYQFKQSYPDVKLRLIPGDTKELKDLLFDGKIELAIVRGRIQSRQVNHDLYFEDKMIAVVNRLSPLAREKSVRLPQLKGENLVLPNVSSTIYQSANENFHKLGCEMKVIYSDSQVSNLADFVTKNMAVGLLMEGLTRFIKNPAIRIIPIVPTIPGNLYLCHLKNKPYTISGRNFADMVRNFQGKPNLNQDHLFDLDKLKMIDS